MDISILLSMLWNLSSEAVGRAAALLVFPKKREMR